MNKIIIIFTLIINTATLWSATPITDAVKVSYKLSHKEIKPGDTLLIEFNFLIKKSWHIYWANPGDAGLPTIIEPKDNSMGKQIDIFTSIPKVLNEEDLVFYCYENQTKMIARFVIDKQAKYGKVNINYQLSWLMCKNECYPGQKDFIIPITISNNARIINKFKLREYPQYQSLGDCKVKQENEKVVLTINEPKFNDLQFFPLSPGYFVYNLIETKKIKDKFEIILPLDKFREGDPEKFEGLFVFRDSKKSRKSYFYSTILIKK